MVEPADLFDLARQVRRLAPPERRSPHAFTETKDELAARIEAIARALGAVPAVRPGRVEATVMVIGSRRVMVQRARGQFGVG